MNADEPQIAKYLEWVGRLEGNITRLTREQRVSWLYLVAGGLFGVIAWRYYSHFLGGALIALGVILWSTALYITWMRIWFYKSELTRTRAELDKLRQI